MAFSCSLSNRGRPPQVAGDFNCYYPAGIQVELTNACNLHCSYCYRDAGSQTHPDILPTDKLLRILREFADKGLRSIELTGGEPLLHPDFLKFAHFCGDSFALIGLLTNGYLVDDFLVQQLVPMRDKMVLSVSLDSYLPAVHDLRRWLSGSF